MLEIAQSLTVVFMLFLNFYLLGTSRTLPLTRAVMMQGILTAAGILFFAFPFRDGWLCAMVILLNKGVIFPFLMYRAMKISNISNMLKPKVSPVLSLILGAIGLGTVFWVCSDIELFARQGVQGVLQTAIFTILCGLFLMATRQMAYTQSTGYLVLSNGIILLGTGLSFANDSLLEAVMLLDIPGMILMVGIILFRISASFDALGKGGSS